MKIINFWLPVLLLLTFADCKKGCADKEAKNFYPRAMKDNATCNYEGKVVIWYKQIVSEGLKADGISYLNIYLDNELQGTYATSAYWSSAPDCGDNGTITLVKDLGFSKSGTYNFSAKDLDGFIQWQETLNFKASTCLQQELQ